MKISRNQTCVYWAPNGFNTFGEQQFVDPVEVNCRWEDKAQQFVDKEGKESVSSSIIYPAQALLLGGYVCLTTLAALSSEEEGDPKTVSGAKEIRNVSASTNIKATEWFYKAWL